MIPGHCHYSTIDWRCPVNYAHPLNKRLYAWWRVTPNLAGGTTWRDMTGRYPGTLTNMAADTDWVGNLGCPGGAGSLDFDGTNDHVALGTVLPNGTVEPYLTLSMWCRPTSLGSQSRYPVSKVTEFSGFSFEVRFKTDSVLSANVWSTTSQVTLDGAAATVNQWKHVALTFNGTDAKLFDNGREAATAALGGIMNIGSVKFQIGSNDNSGYFQGQISSVRLNGCGLPPAAVKELYTLESCGGGDLFNRVQRRRYFVAAAGGGSAIVPVAQHSYRRRRVA